MRKLTFIFLLLLYFPKTIFGQNNFYSVGEGLNEYVRAMYYDSLDQKLYVGGQFVTTVDTLNVFGTAAWDGQQWDSLNSGIKPSGPFSGPLPWWPSRITKF